MDKRIWPVDIKYRKQSRILEIAFEDGAHFQLPAEYLRVYSPSAEVRGHGPGQEILQVGKESVAISAIEQVGNYAVRLVFDDGHDSGIYTWKILYELGTDQDAKWQNYLNRMKAAGYSRQPKDTKSAS